MSRRSSTGLPTSADLKLVLETLDRYAYSESVEDVQGDYRLESGVEDAIYPRLIIDSQGVEISGTTREVHADRQAALADGEEIINRLLDGGSWTALGAPVIAIHAADHQHAESDRTKVWFAAFQVHLTPVGSHTDQDSDYPFEVAG